MKIVFLNLLEELNLTRAINFCILEAYFIKQGCFYISYEQE